MSSILDRTNEFIAKFELLDTNEFRESLSDFVTGCWGDHFKIVHGEPIPDDKKSSGKVSKADKIEDPTECKERDDLRNCTAGTLNEFSKTNGLRVGGNKKEIMDRVWRFLQGTNSDEDISPRTKPKKEKKVNEKHDCYGCTSKGTPCAVAATVEVDGCWFCWRHEESAAEIIASKGSSSTAVPEKVSGKGKEKVVAKEKKVSEKVSEKEVKKVSEKKKGKKVDLETDDSDAEVKKVSEKKKGKKPVIVEPEPESEDEDIQLVDDESELNSDEE